MHQDRSHRPIVEEKVPEIVEEDEMTSQEHVAVGKFIPHERIVGVPSLSALEEMHQLLSFFSRKRGAHSGTMVRA